MAFSTFTVNIHTPTVTQITATIANEKTEINAAGIQIVRDSTYYVRLNRAGSSSTILQVGGAITATNNITAYASSDLRLKNNINIIQSALDKIEKINGVEFDWNNDYIEQYGGEDGYFVRKHDVGVIAQELEEVLPEVVATREDGYKAVRYEKIVPLLIQAIKELKKQIDILKSK